MEIVCPHCHATNRVADDRLADAPVCGVCKQEILPATPIELTDENFANFVEKTGLPVVIDFWASWCGPCRMMAPMYAEAAKQLQGRAILAKVDTDANPQVANRFGIRSIPTLVVLEKGRELSREAGARPATEIVRWVEDQTT
ncbi:thioredoxin TrxC [Uliginosibacterium gangwonense]|uniref:thioredoxin TrxC n=1 Tax=Uliginosibacterium gangwonense TaxID=392736 RepID=UPI000363446D